MAWAPDYCTASELAAYMRIDDTNDDTQMGFAIAAASRAVDEKTQRQFGLVASAEARYYTARLDARTSRWVVDIDDLTTQSGLLVHSDVDSDSTYTGQVLNFSLRPGNAVARGCPWTQLMVLPSSTVSPTTLVDGVRVTARWGWTSVPAAVKQATLMQAARLLTRRDSPYGVAGSPQDGSEVRLLARLDPDVEVALRPYKRRGWVFA